MSRLIDPFALLMPSSVWIVARLSWNASPFPTANEGKQFSIDDLDRITFGATHHSETPRFVLRARGEKRRSEDSCSCSLCFNNSIKGTYQTGSNFDGGLVGNPSLY
jgi:hypothetical protein